MCGRFALTLPNDAMAQLFSASPANDLPDIPNFNICPTNQVHAVVSEGGQRRLVAHRWGFLPHWYQTLSDGPLLINARSETVAEKPAFRSAARERRCLIPATGFYEWTKDANRKRLPWYITAPSEEPLVFAGVWQTWSKGNDPISSCAIVTTSATSEMSKIHHRMPVILRAEDWALWLGEAGHGAATLMKAAEEHALQFWRVHPTVNSNRATGAQLIEPL